MAVFSITPADVLALDGVAFQWIDAGVAIEAGDAVYKAAKAPPNDDEFEALLGVNTSEAAARLMGVALSDGAAGQPVKVATGGSVKVGSVFTTSGTIVVVSSTAGVFEPYGDLVQNDHLFIVGVSRSDGETLDLIMKYGGIYGVEG